MKAFILAAGLGERLRPITDSVPKPLVPVNDIPSICYSIMLLKEAGINDAVCNLHYKHQNIIDFFKSNNYFGMNIEFSIEDEILGTGGGLKKCESNFSNDDIVVINSDIITDVNLTEVEELFKSNTEEGLVVLHRCRGGHEIPTVSVEDNMVLDFKNFLKSGVTPKLDYMGIAFLSPVIFKYLVEDFSSIVYTGFVDLIRHHGLSFYEHNGMWEDIGTIESLEMASSAAANSQLLQQRISEIKKGGSF